MTHTNSSYRPLAVLLAAAFTLGLWLPTLSAAPAQAQGTCAAATLALPELA